ncbi:MAG: hypothetical protein ACLGI2_14330 [Acidimicrobiia bacterium]
MPSTQGEELHHVPVGPVPRVLLGACRPGPAIEPIEERDGWDLFHLADQSGDTMAVALRSHNHPDHDDEDDKAAAFLRRARTNPRALGELQALLTLALERDGLEGQWLWGDTARAVYGPAAKSHHIDHIRMAAALLCRGQWPAFDDGTPPGPRASPWGGSSLLHVETHGTCAATDARHCRCLLTARLNEHFARALRHVRHRAPSEHLRLPQEDHTNPEGRRLSRADLLRVRTTAIHHWHAGIDTPTAAGPSKVRALTFQELLSLAGIDVNAQVRRRHLGDALADVIAALRSTAAWLGVGVLQAPVRARRLLGTVLHIAGPAAPPAARPATRPRPASSPALSTTGASRPKASRAPPRPH